MDIDTIIERYPELPYFIIATYFLAVAGSETALRVFSFGFIFLSAGITIGLLLKGILKTERPREYECFPGAEYDVPSLHTLLSSGAVTYMYYIDPIYMMLLTPLAVLYMISRLRTHVHTTQAVFAGVLIGIPLGIIIGRSMAVSNLHGLEVPLTVMFFFTPYAARKYWKVYEKEHVSQLDDTVKDKM